MYRYRAPIHGFGIPLFSAAALLALTLLPGAGYGAAGQAGDPDTAVVESARAGAPQHPPASDPGAPAVEYAEAGQQRRSAGSAADRGANESAAAGTDQQDAGATGDLGAGTAGAAEPGAEVAADTEHASQAPGAADTASAGAGAQGTDADQPGHGSAAMDSMVLGGILGGQVGGPVGAAAGAVVLGIYGAVTGEVPLAANSGGGGRPPRNEVERDLELEREIQTSRKRESRIQGTLETAIRDELRRQEDLLREIEAGESSTGTALLEPEENARRAPRAPKERVLPASIYEESYFTIPDGAWDGKPARKVLARSLDADRNGAPEEVRYHDPENGDVLRKMFDRDYDGRMDSWTLYRGGLIAELRLDEDGDGAPDEWQHYGRSGLMTRREMDHNKDGEPDAVYIFERENLVMEQHDSDYDGNPDRVVRYARRELARVEEDTDLDGRLDTWTDFGEHNGREVIGRIERDSNKDGAADTFETYAQVEGDTLLTMREEDRNGDGGIDVVSFYENGKLKRREIRNPVGAGGEL